MKSKEKESKNEKARLSEGIKRILDAVYQNVSLQEIVDIASELFDNSILINDVSYNILAKSYRTKEGGELLERLSGYGFINKSIVDAMRSYDIFATIRGTNQPLITRQPEDGKNWLFKTVKIRGIAVADIAVLEDNRPFRDLDMELIEELSKLISIEFQKNDFFKLNRGEAYSYFVKALLEGSLTNYDTIFDRAKSLHWNLSKYFQVAVASNSEWTTRKRDISYVADQLASLIPDGRWSIYQNNIVFIISRPEPHIPEMSRLKPLNEFALDNYISIGFSNVFSDINQTPMFYFQALHACKTYRPGQKRAGLINYSEIMIQYTVETLLKETQPIELLHPSLVILQEYDKKYNTEFMDTLREYLLCAKNVTKTSKNLNIHRNTLLYRLNRIREIADIIFEDGNEYFKMMLHLKILEYRK